MAEAAHSFDDSAGYERFVGHWGHTVGAVFLDWIAPPTGMHWLDVGCGTGLFTVQVLNTCLPASVSAIDPAQAQINHARRQPWAQTVNLQVADAHALPFADRTFDVIAAALAINFISDRPRALAEMRRVTRGGGIIAGYVWDFVEELSPSGPFRHGLRQFGIDVPDIPGTQDSRRAALNALFEQTGLHDIATRTIDATVSFSGFEDFWQAQTPSYSPTTKMIAAMNERERKQLMETVCAALPVRSDGKIEYPARANAIKARVPG
jgi:ubiquinone/menaquinone biosynthesis C-methylase UbiE